MQDSIQKDIDHHGRVVEQNSYPANFIHNGFAPLVQKTADTSSHDEKQEEEKGPLVVILYMIEMSENIRKFNIRVVFKSRQTLP